MSKYDCYIHHGNRMYPSKYHSWSGGISPYNDPNSLLITWGGMLGTLLLGGLIALLIGSPVLFLIAIPGSIAAGFMAPWIYMYSESLPIKKD